MEHVEQAPSSHDSKAVGEHGFVGESAELPKGYFYSPFFLGTTVAVGFNLMVSTLYLVNFTMHMLIR